MQQATGGRIPRFRWPDVIGTGGRILRNTHSGDDIKVFNGRGHFVGVADVTDDIREGVVYAGIGYWDSMLKSNTGVNAVTDDRHTDMGRSGAYSDLLVQIEKPA